MRELHEPTLFLASGIVGGALLMLLALQTRKPYPGFVRVVVGMQVLAAANVIGGLRGYVPDAILILQVAAFGCFALIDSGIRLFCGVPRHSRWPYVYVLASILLETYLFFTRPLPPRIIANSLVLIPIFVDSAIPLLKVQVKGTEFSHRFTAAVFVLASAAGCFRIKAVLDTHYRDSPYFAVNPANAAFFLLTFFILFSLAFGFIALTHERLVAELTAAHKRLIAESEEKTRIERQLAKTERLAAVGRLAGGIAHFLNNQMYIIQLTCSLLRQSRTTRGSPPEMIEQIEKASGRSAGITRRLEQYAQTKVLRASRFDPLRLLDEILPNLSTAAGEKIKVTTSCSSNVPFVEVDSDQLKETVFALIRNAREAMPAGGKLTISLREEELDAHRAKQLSLQPGTFLLLSVSDTGSGMDDDTQRRLFEPFFTSKNLATAEGLGLASAFGFIQQSGGTIAVRSRLGLGSTFELYLPTAPAVRREIAA